MRSFWSTHTAAREEKSKPRTSAEPYKFVLDLDEGMLCLTYYTVAFSRSSSFD